ncbi:MAG: NPCBM/NEW2 domain-containing protein [Planctomycetaceae bacterium]|nr:NPCBM/NEW2 domain-containing protein [Planctomycetaceae bacterium]
MSGLDDWRRTTRPHLLVRPLSSVDLPGKKPRPHVRVASDLIRRIVLVPRRGRPLPPATILTRDGREVGFRSLRFVGAGVIVLVDGGPQRLSFDEIAEIRLADRDPWEMYPRMVAWLAPQAATSPADAAAARLMRAETDDGLVATTAVDPLHGAGDPRNQRSWHILAQPAWSLDPLWLPHAGVRRRIVFSATEVPLSLVEPKAVDRKATFGGSWTWEIDRNVQGGPLSAKGLPYGWGFGTQATSVMAFGLPPFATAFRAGAALDDAAGAGGCVKASVHLGDAAAKPLWQSRDVFDWLDPVVSLAPEGLAAAVRDRLPATMAPWRDWEIVGQPTIRTLVDPLSARESPHTLRQSLAAGAETVLRRKLEVSKETTHLVVGVSRTAASASRIEIRIDGEAVTEADVPERKAGPAVLPFVVPLERYVGRSILVEVAHRGSDGQSFVEWAALGPTSAAEARVASPSK